MLTPEERKLDMMQHLGLEPKPAPKARVKPLPPQAAPCGLVMDGDRLPMHTAQCLACAQGVQAQSYAGIDKVAPKQPAIAMVHPKTYDRIADALKHQYPPPRTDDSGNMERIAKRRGHEMPAVTPTHCGVCFQAGPTVAQRWCRRNAGGVKFQRTLCDGCYLTEERAIFVSASGNLKPSGVLRNGALPERLDHRPPPLTHSSIWPDEAADV